MSEISNTARSPEEIDVLAVELGPVFGPIVVFAAETGLRTNEWIPLERRDVDRSGPAVLVQRRYANGTLTPYPKTVGSRRRVPLSAHALDALDRLPPRLDTKLVFAATRGGYIGLSCATRSRPRRSPLASRSSSWPA
jgi:integrase